MHSDPTTPPSATFQLRMVHRAASDLRRGVPVLLDVATVPGPEAPLVVLAAETAGPGGVQELAEMGTELPVLLLAPLRAAAVLRRPAEMDVPAVAVQLPPDLTTENGLRGLADPTLPQVKMPTPLETVASPPLASAALALAKLAKLLPAVLAVPARPDLRAELAPRGMLSIAATDVLSYPNAEVATLRRIATAPVPLDAAPDARVVAFRSEGSGLEHLAIVIGDPARSDAPLVRIHSECFTGDLLGSMRCDCGPQLREAIRRIAEAGAGVVLYLAQEGRGIGLINKLRAYTLQDRGLDTLDANRVLGWGADERNFLISGTMLKALGIRRVRLLTNNPDKVAGLSACGIEVVGREAHAVAPNGVNDEYLATKAARFGHMID